MIVMFLTTEYLIVTFSLVLILFFSLQKKTELCTSNSIISSDVSHILKAIACIVIVMHHFALRRPDCENLLLNTFRMGGGTWSLVIFLLLSAYGITKSELKKPRELTSYFKHRILKLLIPFWVCVVFYLVLYSLFSPEVHDANVIKSARLGSTFIAIGNGDFHWFDYLLCFTGIKSVSAGFWFVLVTLYAYLLFFVVKTLCKLENRRKSLIFYVLGISVFGIITYVAGWSGHYYRNLWSLVLGFAFALYEKELFKNKKIMLLLWIFLNVYFLAYIKLLHDVGYIYPLYANIALITIVLFQLFITRNFHLRKKGNLIISLSGLSYCIYLIHGCILSLQWSFTGYISLIMVVFVVILFSILLNKIINLFYNRIS